MSDDTPDDATPRPGPLGRPEFPVARVGALLGLSPERAEVELADPGSAREAVLAASRAYLRADDDRRAGRTPSSAIAAHPDFPLGVAEALVGAGVLWGVTEHVPAIALRAAKDHHLDGRDELAASFVALVQETARLGADDAEAWAGQSLLVAILQRSGDPAAADALARDLAAHAVPLDLWRDDAAHLPDDSLAWHGGALVEGMPPRRDERSLSVEGAGEYLEQLMTRMLRDAEAEDDGDGPPAPGAPGAPGDPGRPSAPGTGPRP